MQNEDVILTVIVPTKNAANRIEGLLDSLRAVRLAARDAGCEIQVIVQDSESVDGTRTIVEKYLTGRDIFRSEKDRGIYEGMNKALRFAIAEWVVFMGADDRILMVDICTRLRAIVEPEVAVVVGESKRGEGVIKGNWGWRLLFGHSVNHQACVYRRRVFLDLLFPEEYRLASDYWVNLKLYWEGVRVIKWRGQVISEYGTDGLSSKGVALGLREGKSIRRQLLGSFGVWVNLVKDMKRVCFKHGDE